MAARLIGEICRIQCLQRAEVSSLRLNLTGQNVFGLIKRAPRRHLRALGDRKATLSLESRLEVGKETSFDFVGEGCVPGNLGLEPRRINH